MYFQTQPTPDTPMIDTPIRILSLNADKSSGPTENALQQAVERNADILVIQEPWFHSRESEDWTKEISTAHSSFIQILPHNPQNIRPRTLTYVRRHFTPSVALAEDSPQDTDIQSLIVTENDKTIQIINIYNQKGRENNTQIRTFQRSLKNMQLQRSTVITGDFNSHHYLWDPNVDNPNSDAEEIVEWFEEKNLQLLNKPGHNTWHRSSHNPSVLDLTLISETVSRRAYNYTLVGELVSDHTGMELFIPGSFDNSAPNPLQQGRFNTAKADWKLFRERAVMEARRNEAIFTNDEFSDLQYTSDDSMRILQEEGHEDITKELEQAAEALTRCITRAAEAAIPRAEQNTFAKAWWTEDLRKLRKKMAKSRREIVIGHQPSIQSYCQARNTYFEAVKKAKTHHWNQFLQKEDAKSIFKAMKYTNGNRVQRMPNIKDEAGRIHTTFDSKCDAFRTALFPPPPNAEKPNWNSHAQDPKWTWPELSKAEVEHACSSKIQSKSPGPDGITQEIITHAYKAIPNAFYHVFSLLINTGYHPQIWRQATGAILPKPNKDSYIIPKSYRIITLLNCLGKVSERIMAQRLSHLAETTNLLHSSQIGGRLKKSAIDAALLLKHQVESNKLRRWKTTTLFMDVKGAYDHVAKYRLLNILLELGLPLSLISWVYTFLSLRMLRLAFDGQMQQFLANLSGIPQGSPISPILFLIYCRAMFPNSRVVWISYVDDISITITSPSFRQNIEILEREAQNLVELGYNSNIQFDIEKTELMHWDTSKEAKTTTLTMPNGKVIQPKQLIKWLGINFDSNLKFKQHVAIKIAKARGAFLRVARLASIERGLTPASLRQLYIACVTSIADYGAILWWKDQVNYTKMLQKLQNLALRKILGVYKTTPILPMEVETALPPPEVRIRSAIRGYAFRLHKLDPSHPINKATNAMLHLTEPATNRVNAGDLQLKRIHNSIKHLTEGVDIEPIRHFHFAPWERKPPYEVEISKLSKDEEAEKHTKMLATNPRQNVYIYSDASSTLSSEGRQSLGIGIGIAVLAPPSERIRATKGINIGPNTIVYNGELEGATKAAEMAAGLAQKGAHFHVYSDNQAGLWRLKTPSDNPGQACQIRAIKAGEIIRRKAAKLTFHWVPGHTEIQGNEAADALAKAATYKRPISNQTSYAMLGLQIKQMETQEWRDKLEKHDAKNPKSVNNYSYRKEFPWKVRGRMIVPIGTPRSTASAFYQLKLGHGSFRSYLYMRDHVDDPLCFMCGEKETPQHLLLACKWHSQARQELKEKLDESRPTISRLLGTSTGALATLEYLQKTRICTQKWRKQRENWGEGALSSWLELDQVALTDWAGEE